MTSDYIPSEDATFETYLRINRLHRAQGRLIHAALEWEDRFGAEYSDDPGANGELARAVKGLRYEAELMGSADV